jgi:protein TonB
VAVPVPAAEAPKAPSVSDAAGGASKTVVVPVPMAAHAGAVAVSTPPAGFRVTMPVLVGAGLVVLIALASAGWLAFRRETAPDAASQPAADAARVASTPVPGPPSHGASSSTTPTVRATQPGAATPGGGPAGSPAKRPGAGRAPVDATAYDMNDVDVKPSVLSSPAPEYPPDARRRRQEDTVVLSVLVSETGRPLEVKVLRKAKKVPAFDTAAVAAVRGWTFKPARRQGKAVRCWYSVGVPFQLRR